MPYVDERSSIHKQHCMLFFYQLIFHPADFFYHRLQNLKMTVFLPHNAQMFPLIFCEICIGDHFVANFQSSSLKSFSIERFQILSSGTRRNEVIGLHQFVSHLPQFAANLPQFAANLPQFAANLSGGRSFPSSVRGQHCHPP
jgi:hypothetical protein